MDPQPAAQAWSQMIAATQSAHNSKSSAVQPAIYVFGLTTCPLGVSIYVGAHWAVILSLLMFAAA